MRTLSALALLVVASAGQAQPPERVRWEYAELSVRSVSPGFFGKDKGEQPKAATTDSSTTVKWTTDKEEATFAGYADFAEKVKLVGFKKDTSLNHQRVQILNHLGNEGWELVESVSGPARTMLFKRRVR